MLLIPGMSGFSRTSSSEFCLPLWSLAPLPFFSQSSTMPLKEYLYILHRISNYFSVGNFMIIYPILLLEMKVVNVHTKITKFPTCCNFPQFTTSSRFAFFFFFFGTKVHSLQIFSERVYMWQTEILDRMIFLFYPPTYIK